MFEYWAGCQPIKGRDFGHCVLRDGQCQDGSHGALCGRSEDCQPVPGRGEHGVCIEGKCHDGREGARCGSTSGPLKLWTRGTDIDCQAGFDCDAASIPLYGAGQHQCTSRQRTKCFADILRTPECGAACLPLCFKDKADFGTWQLSNDCSSRLYCSSARNMPRFFLRVFRNSFVLIFPSPFLCNQCRGY